jgi:2-dehydro-3-deoxyphosphogluconate aldolase/(4S)-4-hydroxy-2-oxoglutarate aldolase
MLPFEARIAKLFAAKIVPIIRADSTDQAARLAQAMIDKGFTCVELTMTTPGALNLIQTLSKDFPEVTFGMGTVIGAHEAREVIDAGVQFVVSPVCDVDIIRPCREAGVVCIPAGVTPTEIHRAWRMGGHVVKVFPAAQAGGASFIKALRGPFPNIPLWASGGVKPQDAESYIAAGAQLVGINAESLM